jgi:hypothetical protein
MTVDVRSAYNLIRITDSDKCKPAFRTRYGQVEYLVISFSLTNVPIMLQSYIHGCLSPYIDDLAACYHDVIPVYSTNEVEHEEHVHQVLQPLRKFGFYCNTEMCQFGVSQVDFLGFVITPD